MNFSSLRSSLISLIRETFSYREGGGESECRWISGQWAQDLLWPLGLRVWGRVRVGPGPRLCLWCLYCGMSLYPGSWISLLRYQLTYLQVDSGKVSYRQCAPLPSIQALPVRSNNNAFLSTFHELNALKFHNNPMHRFYYNHGFKVEKTEAQRGDVTYPNYIDSKWQSQDSDPVWLQSSELLSTVLHFVFFPFIC